MLAAIGLDCTWLPRTVTRGVKVIKACRWLDSRQYLSSAPKLHHCGGYSLRQSARAKSAMNSAHEGKRSAAYFAVDEHIRVYT